MNKICNDCGQDLAAQAVVCNGCGADAQRAQQIGSQQSATPKTILPQSTQTPTPAEPSATQNPSVTLTLPVDKINRAKAKLKALSPKHLAIAGAVLALVIIGAMFLLSGNRSIVGNWDVRSAEAAGVNMAVDGLATYRFNADGTGMLIVTNPFSGQPEFEDFEWVVIGGQIGITSEVRGAWGSTTTITNWFDFNVRGNRLTLSDSDGTLELRRVR